jgi:WD40 repeat protein
MYCTKPARRGISVFTVSLFLAATAAWADDKSRTDASGDPLPDGAVTRLGSLRWRHSGPVKFVAYVNGGKEIVSSAEDGVFYVWDVQTGKELRRFGEPLKIVNQFQGFPPPPMIGWQDPNRMFQIAVPEDGKILAVAAPDQKIHIYDIAAAKELRSFAHGHQQQFVAALVFAADGKTLVSRGTDQKIKLWDPAEGKAIREFNEGGQNNVFFGNVSMPLALSPDGKFAAGISAGIEGGRGWVFALRVWDIKEGKEVQKMKDANNRGQAMNIWPVFSPDNKNIAWPSAEGPIFIYEAATGKEVQKIGEANGERRALRLQYSSDGKTLAALTSDQTIVLYDPGTGKQIKEIGQEPPGPYGKAMAKSLRINPMNFSLGNALAFSPDGKSVVQGWGNLVRQWNLETGKGNEIDAGHAGDVTAVVLSSDGKTVFTAGADNTVRKWSLETGKQAQPIDLPDETLTTFFAGPGHAVTRDESAVRLWDLATGKQTMKLEGAGGTALNPFTGLPGQFSLAPDGKSLAVSTSDQSVRSFNLETGKQTNVDKEIHLGDSQGRKMLYSVGASPDGTTVAVQIYIVDFIAVPGGGINQQVKFLVRLHDLESGRALWETNVNNNVTGQCRCLSFSPDGRNIAFINGDNSTVIVLEASTGKERWRFSVPNVMNLTFSADSRFVGVGNFEGVVKVMDIRANKEVASIQAHPGRIRTVAFSQDAEMLFTGGGDGTALVWSIKDPVQKARQQAEVDAETVKRLWADLGDGDGPKAFRAVVALSSSPKSSSAWLKEQLKAAKGEDNAKIEKLIADLDNDEFETRQKAYEELTKLGLQAQPLLTKALKEEPSREARTRIEELLERLEPGQTTPSADAVRQSRAIEVLELLGTPEARDILGSLAKGAPGKLTTEATLALKHLGAQK